MGVAGRLGEKARSDQKGSLWAHRPGVLLGTGAKALPPAPDAVFFLRVAKSAPVPAGFPCVIEHNGPLCTRANIRARILFLYCLP